MTYDDVDDAGEEEDLFHALVVSLHRDKPDQHRRDRDRDELADPEQVERSCHARELRHDVREIQQDQQDHDEESDAQAELFADQVGQALCL